MGATVGSMAECTVGWAACAASGMSARISRQCLPPAAAPIIFGLMPSKQRSWFRRMVASVLPVAGLITMLLALVFLQLRWSARVSDAERARLQQNLQRSTGNFQSAFTQDLFGICQTLQSSQPRELPVLVDQLFDRYSVWRRISRHPALIGGLYLWSTSSAGANSLLKLNMQDHRLEPVAWPKPLQRFAAQSTSGKHGLLLPRQPDSWLWDERIPALVHPVYTSEKTQKAGRPQFFGYLLVVFDPTDFEQVYLPNLGGRFFPLSNGFVFQLIERDAHHEYKVAYQSDPRSIGVFPHADATVPLLATSLPEQTMLYSAPASPGAVSSPVELSGIYTQKWRIAVRHQAGSVDAAVISLRRRDFALSIIVLAMLLVSLITILAATRRARRLAQLQMEFASGVSHELRTPLAVISSAAENLADGIITDGDKIRDYGALIHQESQRLSGMVDHILEFAQLESHPHKERLEIAATAEILHAVLANERRLVEAAGVSLETNIPADIPLLHTNPAVLQQCLQNLVSNALKYGSGGGRIVLAVSAAHEHGEDRVLIRVEDFGAGIAPEELPHIFEPFYRAGDVRDSQIPGTGLGLSLTRKMMEGLGGRITVESLPGKGSAFTLHVPANAGDGGSQA